MADFLKAITDKFLDFFNIGRAVSIFIPGALVSFAILMLLSLMFFPPRITLDQAIAPEATIEQKSTAKSNDGASTSTKNKNAKPLPTTTRKVAEPVPATAPTERRPTSGEIMSKQITADFDRVSAHYWIVALFSLVIGIMLYEVGNNIIGAAKSTVKMYRFKENPGADKPQLVPDEGNAQMEVGLIYFAPFLKEDFTGKENYYNFLVSEYYRFLEFSAVMPLAIGVTALLAAGYYFAACRMIQVCCHYVVAFGAVVLVWVLLVVFHKLVFSKVYGNYRKASADLIKGVADVINKGLLKKG